MQPSDTAKIFAFIEAVNSLKYEIRFGDNCKSPFKDSVASHCWRLALLSYLLAEQLNMKLDVSKVMKFALIHDLPEVLIGDISFDKIYTGEAVKLGEKEAMEKLSAMLPSALCAEFLELWKDYEASNSLEAKFVKIVDKLEAAHQAMFMGVKSMTVVPPMVTHSNKLYGEVPEFDELIRYVREELRAHFAEHGEPWLPEYELK